MEALKKILAVLLTAAALLAVVFLAGRYGWKLQGFRACQGAGIDSVEVFENAVEISGFYPGSFPEGFCGYYAEERDGTLYVGFRFSAAFGFLEPGDFDVTIPVQGKIREVVLKTKTMESRIWPTETEGDAEPDGCGVYVRLERGGISSIALHGGRFTCVRQNADGSALETGGWEFMGGEEIAQLSREENRSVLFTVSARAADGAVLADGSFLYDAALEKLYVTISEDGVTCSTSDAPGAPADVPSVLTLPILDEIDADVMLGTAGSSLSAVRAASKLLDWGANTGLGADEVGDAASTWLANKNDDLSACIQKLELVDSACRDLLTDGARELLDTAGCADTDITWGSELPEPVEAVMQAAGLRQPGGA